MRYILTVVLLLLPFEALAQIAATEPLDPVNFPRLKNFGAYRSSSNARYVYSNDDSKHPIPGETLVLANLKGPGIVTHLWITIADNEYAWPRLLRLRVYYDGHKTPSIDTPLGDFFGVGHGYERNLNSLLVRNASFGRARNSYWPMPFRKSCKITVTNEGHRRVTSFYYHVDWQKHATLPEDIGYLHAYYRQGCPPPLGKNYTILDVRGTGHYVGTVLNILQTDIGWFGEGDDFFYVDGEKAPRIEGTGSEDYFNDAWALRVSDGAWTGIPVAEGEGLGARLTGYRWHVVDPVPFTKSLRLEIEHYGWTYNPDGTARSGFEERFDNFSSVAFWYQKGVNEGLAEPPYGDARLPLGNAEQIEVENSVKDVTAEKGTIEVQKEVFWSKDLLFLKAQGVGSKMNVPLDVPRDGRYEVITQIAQSPDYGDYVITLDGKLTNSTTLTWAATGVLPQDAEIVHNYQPEIYVAIDHRLGWFDLTKGRHTLTFTCVGKDPLATGFNVGMDGVILAEVKKVAPKPETPVVETAAAAVPVVGPLYRGKPLACYVTKLKSAPAGDRAELLRAIGAFGVDAATAAGQVTAALSASDPAVRGAAAWALSEMGPKAATAVPALRQALKDENVEVREFSTLALRALGKAAAAAIPDLCAALKDPVDSVRMTAALALGQMGDSAKEAVPALIEVLPTDEVVQVLRNTSTALGQIGPAAQGALPALQEVRKKIRVQYSADEAILKIEGRPVPVWH